jgi:hypothetical protein
MPTGGEAGDAELNLPPVVPIRNLLFRHEIYTVMQHSFRVCVNI